LKAWKKTQVVSNSLSVIEIYVELIPISDPCVSLVRIKELGRMLLPLPERNDWDNGLRVNVKIECSALKKTRNSMRFAKTGGRLSDG
jgi:hypothetical protein